MQNSNESKLEVYEDYKKILRNYGEYVGFRELLILDELESKLETYQYFNKANKMIVEFEVSENIGLSTISNIVSKINNKANAESEVILFPTINQELKDNEIILQVLISGL